MSIWDGWTQEMFDKHYCDECESEWPIPQHRCKNKDGDWYWPT